MEVIKITELEKDNKENIPPCLSTTKPGPNGQKGKCGFVKINGRRPLRDITNLYRADGFMDFKLPSSDLVSGFSSNRKRKLVDDDCSEHRSCSKILRRDSIQ